MILRRFATPLALLVSSFVLWLIRPGVVENALRSPVAWAVGVGTLLSGLGAREAARRLGTRPAVAQAFGTGVVVVLVVALLAPSFRQRTLVEELPDELTSATGPVATAPSTSASTSASPSAVTAPATAGPPATTVSAAPTQAAVVAPAAPRATAPRATTAAPAPTSAPTTSALVASGVDRTGALSGIGHSARGTVHLRSASGAAYVLFDDVNIEGTVEPSVHLVPAGRRTPSGGIRLGALKAEKGTFSYRLPDSVDLTKQWSVLVWCDPYDTPIAAADPR